MRDIAALSAAPVPPSDGAGEKRVKLSLVIEALESAANDARQKNISGFDALTGIAILLKRDNPTLPPSATGAAEPVATPQQVQEACAQVADRAARQDEQYAAKYPDEANKFDQRAHRAKTIATSIRALIPPIASPPVRGDREMPNGATHMRRPEYITAWLFDRVATMPVWLIEKYKSDPLPEKMIGHYATAVDGDFWRWFDPAKFEEMFVPVQPGAGERPRWKHKKRGTVYTEIGRGKLQTMDAGGLTDNEPMVIYQGDDGQLWVRDAVEFEDGRFEFMPPSRQPPQSNSEGGQR